MSELPQPKLNITKLFDAFFLPVFSGLLMYLMGFTFVRFIVFLLLDLLKLLFGFRPFNFGFIGETFQFILPHSLIILFVFLITISLFWIFNQFIKVKHLYIFFKILFYSLFILYPLFIDLIGGVTSALFLVSRFSVLALSFYLIHFIVEFIKDKKLTWRWFYYHYKLVKIIVYVVYILLIVYIELSGQHISNLVFALLKFHFFELIDSTIVLFSDYLLIFVITWIFGEAFSEFKVFPTFSVGVEILSLRNEKARRDDEIKKENQKVLSLFDKPKLNKKKSKKRKNESSIINSNESIQHNAYFTELEQLKKDKENNT
jgi:hypothetical protein